MPPPPKPAATRQRRNRVSTQATLEPMPAEFTPLPERFSSEWCNDCKLRRAEHKPKWFEEREVEPHPFDPRPVPWLPLTQQWWQTIWASPMVDEWMQADVPNLLMLAALVDEFWLTNEPKIAGEIRMQQREYGLSPLARRSLQWEIARGEEAERRRKASNPPTQPVADPRKTLRALA